MNKTFIKRLLSTVFTLSLITTVSFSQVESVDFLKSAPADGVKLLEAYIAPWANAFGAGLNGNWYNTAKPHKFGGFDLTVGFSVGVVPTADQSFNTSQLGLSSALSGGGATPTVAGAKKAGPAMTYSATTGGYTVPLATFNLPQGTNWRYIPVPTAQIGIGLPLGTEIKVRYMPKINIKDGNVGLWGVGLMHSIMQYLPGSKLLPFDVSLFGGYTKLTANVPISLQPGSPADYTAYNVSTSFDDQNLRTVVDAINISAIASANLPVITFYGGIGYTKTKTVVKLEGNFPTPTVNTDDPLNPYSEYTDAGVVKGDKFPSMNIENFSGMRANIGFRLKFAVITIHADYTRSQYNVFSTGMGISFR